VGRLADEEDKEIRGQKVSLVTIHDLRRLGYCMRGCRRWFAQHGIDWQRVRREGITTDELRATNDALADRVIEDVEARDGRR